LAGRGILNSTRDPKRNRRLANAPDSDRAAREADQQEKRFAAAMEQAHQRELQALDDNTLSLHDRLDIALERLHLEALSRDAELKRQVRDKELTQAQADLIVAADRSARNAERAALLRQEGRQRLEALAEYDRTMAQFATEQLYIQQQLAVTVKDRLALQLKIYDAERAEQRAVLERKLQNNPELTAADRSRALGQFDQNSAAGRGGVLAQASGVRQMFHDGFRDGVLAGLRDGNLGSAMKAFWNTIADNFANRLADKLADNLYDALDWLIRELSGSSVLSPGGTSTGSFFDDLWSMIGGGGRAAGGPVGRGSVHTVAEHGTEIAVFGRTGQVFDANTTARILGQRGGGAPQMNFTYAPVNNVQGNSEDVQALRRDLVRQEQEFRSKTLGTVNDAFARGLIATGRK
jgi:hypothetical protein